MVGASRLVPEYLPAFSAKPLAAMNRLQHYLLNEKMNQFLYIVAVFFIMKSCTGQEFLSDDKHLIGGYYFFEAGPQSCIIYNGRKEYRGTGAEVVPGKVIETSVRGRHLFVTNMNLTSEKKSYWIIDTSRDIKAYYRESMPPTYYDSVLTSNVLGPLTIEQYTSILDTLRP